MLYIRHPTPTPACASPPNPHAKDPESNIERSTIGGPIPPLNPARPTYIVPGTRTPSREPCRRAEETGLGMSEHSEHHGGCTGAIGIGRYRERGEGHQKRPGGWAREGEMGWVKVGVFTMLLTLSIPGVPFYYFRLFSIILVLAR
jgi:hypothetical protein